MAAALRADQDAIITANDKDLANGRDMGLSDSMLDRLALDLVRIEGIAAGIEAIADLPDPVGETMDQWDRPNGLNISRVPGGTHRTLDLAVAHVSIRLDLERSRGASVMFE